MGSSISVLHNKSIYLSYDDTSNDLEIQHFMIYLNRLIMNSQIKLSKNDINIMNDSETDILIFLISKGSINNPRQSKEINNAYCRKSIFIDLDGTLNFLNNKNLSDNEKTIFINRNEHNDYDQIMTIIMYKLQESL